MKEIQIYYVSALFLNRTNEFKCFDCFENKIENLALHYNNNNILKKSENIETSCNQE